MNRNDLIALGHTSEYIDYTMSSIPFLLDETEKRLRYDPWYDASVSKETHFLYNNSKFLPGVQLVKALLNRAQRFDVLTLPPEEFYNLETLGLTVGIDPLLRASDPEGTVIIRGERRTIEDLPLYLDKGMHSLSWTYPLFDWSELQVHVALLMIIEGKV